MAFTVFADNSDSEREEGPLTPHNTEKSSTESSPKRKVETAVEFKSRQNNRVDTPKTVISSTNKENWDSKKQQYSTDRQAKKVKAIENSDRLICGQRVPLADITTLYQTKILKAKLEDLQVNEPASSKPVIKSKIPKPASKQLMEKDLQSKIKVLQAKNESDSNVQVPADNDAKTAKVGEPKTAKPRALGAKNPNLPEGKKSVKTNSLPKLKTFKSEKPNSKDKKRTGGIMSIR
ncbi:hypothetical protein HK103_004794 [Boothiomyces macroporosus]|uniref:Uncharacterized protein n=1 Tax=Boothiomyces macroporosus TaxID=261099 RepID=A0AAD5UJV7_9FUNG|nr:hypothetical protein HK103_004794 [Boothiomyces macroporosus]